MSGDKDLDAIMDAIYFAPHRKDGWQDCLDQIRQLCTAESARLRMCNKDDHEPVMDYQSRTSDPQGRRNDACLKQCAVRHDMEEGHLELLVEREADEHEQPLSADARPQLEGLMPHIARAMRQQAVARVLNDRQAAVQQQKQGAMLLLDGEQNVVFLSGEAESLLSRTRAIKIEARRLRLNRRHDQVALDSLIERCLDSKTSGMVNLKDPNSMASRLLVSTIQTRSHKLHPSQGLAAVFMVVEECEDAGKEEAIGQWLGLTEAEARVAGLIAQGRRPAEIAEEIELSVHTVRHHVKNIYRKTGTHSQSQLTALVLNLPA